VNSLRGKRALVTGGSRGIGAATALLLAEYGVDVAIGYRSRKEDAVRVVEQARAAGVRAFAYSQDIGTREGPRIVEDVEKYRDILLRRGWQYERDLHYERVEGAEHNEAAWSQRVAPFLRFLYPAS